jgi:hypothetical protein
LDTQSSADRTTEPRALHHSSRHIRLLLIVIGTVSLVTGIIGIILPLLPTTPFLLLAAACYARSSERFYNGLLANRWFGPPIRQWREKRTVSPKSKRNAVIIVLLSFIPTILFVVEITLARIVLSLMAIGLITIILSLPSGAGSVRNG